MFENWQKMVKENQEIKTKKSTNNSGTKFDSVFIDDFWKSGDSDREQSSGCVFKEEL